MKKTLAAGLGVCVVAMAFAAKDPVIMTINGEDVPKSEFEYLYNKNNQQQINPQTLDEYVEMFKLYKMKVADARAEGIDTLPSFIKEAEQYRHELAAPYLADSVYINKLVDESYDRANREVEAYHIMLFKTRDMEQNRKLRARIDSLKGVLDGGADFADIAMWYSQDRNSSKRGGRMGYIQANQYPYSFEVVAFALPEGKISDVVESPVGYHILKGGKSRAARGKVKVSHILKLTRGDKSLEASAKATIDSIYDIVSADPSKFAELAAAKSDDRNSARQGGALPWFGAGEMVQEFDSVSFALPVGAVSKPFATSYGYHIVYKTDSKGIQSRDEMKPAILAKMSNSQDERYKMIRDHQTKTFAARHKAKINDKTVAAMMQDVNGNGLDSTFMATWSKGAKGAMPIAVVDGRNVPASEFTKTVVGIMQTDPEMARVILQNNIDAFFNGLVTTAEENQLAKTQPEYRNLLKEYVDGSLLYEVSVRKVWDKAAKDTEGLKKYFESHKSDYTWKEPHVKGIFVQTVNDSVADLIKKRASELKDDEIVPTLRKEFKGKITVEKILIAKGVNAMVDHVAFDGPKVESSVANYKTYFMINPRILNAPEEVDDVKGMVTSDYQNMFQEEWERSLRARYPVKVNEKVLKSVSKK